ncbi:MAG: hypothetical protein KAR31_10840 [Candidatus Omnitrophica bacterium]|nr:hypothetical protein [Candidatus Omnitrophota bacterium]
MKHLFLSVLLLGFLGCASVGTMPHTTGTQTDLSRSNFKVIGSAIQGVDTGFFLFGIIPIKSPSYANAMADLHNNIDMNDKAAALVNVAQDKSNFYLFLFSTPKITITADVVEFYE